MAQKKILNRDNPALNFISTAITEEIEQETTPGATEINNNIPAGYRINPLYVEKKTKRLQLVIQPSLYEKIKSQAQESGESINNYIHTILEEATRSK